MSFIDAIMGKNMAIDELLKNGCVGYSESGKILWESAMQESDGTISTYEDYGILPMTVGEAYTVKTDSGIYNAICKTANIEGIAGVMLGNGSYMGMEDTGESYFVFSTINEQIVFAVDYNCGFHMTISTAETIVPIDPKFLPGVCLPVVELTTQPTAEGAALTEAEIQALLSVGESPCILKFNFDPAGMRVSVLANYVGLLAANGKLFEARLSSLMALFAIEIAPDGTVGSFGATELKEV